MFYGMNYGLYPFPNPATYSQQPAFSAPTPQSSPSVGQSFANTAMPVFLQVANAKDFDTVTIQPGRQALIMAQNEPYIAFKSADAMGIVNTTLYHIEPVASEQIGNNSQEYVTKEEFQRTIQQIMEGISKTSKQPKKETISE